MKTERRSKFLINPTFQLRMIALGILILLAAFIILYFSNLYFFHNFKTLGVEVGLKADHTFFKFPYIQEKRMFYIFIITYTIMAGFVFTLILFLSHKIAGPLYRFKIHMREAQKTNLVDQKNISFRKGDFFIELEKEYNLLIKSLKEEN